MLLSMTGFGESRRTTDAINIAVEVRAVNNRYLKVMTRAPEAYAAFENEVEKTIRKNVARGTLNVSIRASLVGQAAATQLNQEVLASYWSQLQALSESVGAGMPADCSSLLGLPDAVSDGERRTLSLREHWPAVAEVLAEAVHKLNEFRRTEGDSMAADLTNQCDVLAKTLKAIGERSPGVVTAYRDRVLERVRELLSDTNATIEENDLIREVSVFADRCDINEEIKRLESHIEQFAAFLKESTSQGRKLEFLIQEMLRETNTIGSKANDVQIAHSVVEMKSAIEKMKEMVQNVE
ncbi:MAG: YicC/YloC family endoribonuclease [Planctomycetaceae bacterium]